MNIVSSLTLIFVAMGMAVALPPYPALHAQLQASINPEGIKKVDEFYIVPPNASSLVIVGPNVPEDFSYYALATSTASCDYEYNSTISTNITKESNPQHFSRYCLTYDPASFLVECSVAKNAKGEDNFIYVNFDKMGTVFDAYGDARGVFTPRNFTFPPGTTYLTPPSTTLFPNLAWTDSDKNTEEFTIVTVFCPPVNPPPPNTTTSSS